MSTSQMIFALWLMILVFSLYAIGRILYQFRTIPANDLIDEKVNWNAKLNPYKVKIYKYYFLPIFIFPYYLYYLSITTNNNLDIVFLLSIATIIVSLSYWLLEFKIKSQTKGFILELEPTKLKEKEIIQKYEFAIENEYFKCELDDFKKTLKFGNIDNKILWEKPNDKGKNKDRQLLLSFLNDCLNNQILYYGNI